MGTNGAGKNPCLYGYCEGLLLANAGGNHRVSCYVTKDFFAASVAIIYYRLNGLREVVCLER